MKSAIPNPDNGFEHSIQRVAVELRSGISDLVENAVGVAPRPATLARRTGLSPSLAARVMRSIGSDQTAGVIRDMPSPQGLSMLVKAAKDLGVPEDVLQRATVTINNYEELINGFPTGRNGLHAALSGRDESSRNRATRDAVQSVFRSMTTLLGFHAEQMVHSYFLIPGRDNPELLDVGVLMYKVGIHRYRPGSPITVFGRRISFEEECKERLESLSGADSGSSPLEFMVDSLCSDGSESIEEFRGPGLYLYTLPKEKPEIGQSINFCGACISRNAFNRYASDRRQWEWESIVPRMPSKKLHINMFVHESIQWDREPELTSSLHGLNSPSDRPDDPALELDQIENWAELKKLSDTGSISIQGIPGYAEMLNKVAGALNAPLSSFRGYQSLISYPVPLIAQTIWLPLSQRSKA